MKLALEGEKKERGRKERSVRERVFSSFLWGVAEDSICSVGDPRISKGRQGVKGDGETEKTWLVVFRRVERKQIGLVNCMQEVGLGRGLGGVKKNREPEGTWEGFGFLERPHEEALVTTCHEGPTAQRNKREV